MVETERDQGSIKHKLMVGTAGTAVVLGAAGFGAYKYIHMASNQDLDDSPEGVIRKATFYCFLEQPNCDVTNNMAIRYSEGNEIYLPLEAIPQTMQDMAVATEDRHFWDNDGIDDKGLLNAIYDDFKDTDLDAGGSTITMQLVNHKFAADKPSIKGSNRISRAISKFDQKKWQWGQAVKLTEDYTAEELLRNPALTPAEAKFEAKKRILEEWFNTIYYGREAVGPETGSQAFYGVSLAQTTLPQQAELVASINEPSGMEGSLDEGRQATQMALRKDRRDKVINDLYEVGKLTADQVKEYQATPINVTPYHKYEFGATADYSHANAVGARYAVDLVDEEFKDLYEAAGGTFTEETLTSVPLFINTSVSFEVNVAINNAVANMPIPQDGRRLAAVAIGPDGGVMGIYGGDYATNPNLVTTPVVIGSMDKIWAYTQAMQAGQINLDTQYPIQPIDPEKYPDNPTFVWEGGDNGQDYKTYGDGASNCTSEDTVRDAIARSCDNTLLQILKDGGQASLDRMDKLMDDFQIPSETAATPGIGLGGREATLLNRTAGVNWLIANRGLVNTDKPYHFINSEYAIENGQVVNKYDFAADQALKNAFVQVIPPEIADEIIEGMRGVGKYGTASKVLGKVKTDNAEKTGTHDNNVVAAIVGTFCLKYGDMSLGVLYRFPDNLNSLGDGEVGGKTPAQVMKAIEEPLEGAPCILQSAA